MNFQYFFFYSPFATVLYSIFYTVLVTSMFATISFAFYLLVSPILSKILLPKTQKQVLSFMLLLFFLPYQVFLMKIPSYRQIVGNYVEWTPEMYQKAMEDMEKYANPSHFEPEIYVSNFYQGVTFFAYIWLGVMIFSAVKLLRTYQKSKKQLEMYLEPICDWALLEEYHRSCEKIGISKKKRPELLQHPAIVTPMLTGCFQPKIFIPMDFPMDSQVLSPIFLHELSHFMRKDLWLQCLGELAKVVHWFNPVVSLLVKMLSFWCEILCDQSVVADFDHNQKVSYAQSILSSAKKEELELRSVAKLCERSWKPLTMKNRLSLILEEKNLPCGFTFLSNVFFLLLCSIFLGFCFKLGEKSPIVDSVFPYVKEIYPEIVIYYPDFQNF